MMDKPRLVDGEKLCEYLYKSRRYVLRHQILAGRFDAPPAIGEERELREALVALANKVVCECSGANEPGQTHAKGCPKRLIQDVLTAKPPANADQRDLTPEEALAEARKRWPGKNVVVGCLVGKNSDCWVYPGDAEDGSGVPRIDGPTFRAAFADADRASKGVPE